ncbi:hypothetical protein WH47_12663 [Habropoda laboriosa]|uniref:Uncharacterized protein n=1 Tax=Habropoda laboriosa TaxID=597456 RepID=A0A0L7QKJ3_9HYME|nr:hypothetical protein WH47_12663 [Habropoda laboriosa]
MRQGPVPTTWYPYDALRAGSNKDPVTCSREADFASWKPPTSFEGFPERYMPSKEICEQIEIRVFGARVGILQFVAVFSAISELVVCKTIDIAIGPIALNFAMERDTNRILVAQKRYHAELKTARITRRNENLALNSFYEKEEGVLYGPGIAD